MKVRRCKFGGGDGGARHEIASQESQLYGGKYPLVMFLLQVISREKCRATN
jgi:hypothetical protein